ncbi:MAG: septum formation initiator family protein [Candidatus Omnitrophica bacterium]|nr:septum formation initiator family protein [Candidatus Omnitrophota bacterium]
MSPTKLKILVSIAGVLLLCAIVYLPGYTKYQDLKARAGELRDEIRRLEVLNKDLEGKIARLQTDVSYLEGIVREELGLAKPGEVVYKAKPKAGGQRAAIEE